MDSQKVVIKSEERRLVYGEVYAPLHIDTDQEAMTAQEIEKMAHRFLQKGRTSKIDVQHNYEETGCYVVESFIARKDDPDGFVEGSWVLGVKIPSEELWEAVKKGDLNGFSFAGISKKDQIEVEVQVTRKLVGMTEQSAKDELLPAHYHTLNLEFDQDGRMVPGVTDTVLSHSHEVSRTTATEKSMEHSHRMILIDNDDGEA